MAVIGAHVGGPIEDSPDRKHISAILYILKSFISLKQNSLWCYANLIWTVEMFANCNWLWNWVVPWTQGHPLMYRAKHHFGCFVSPSFWGLLLNILKHCFWKVTSKAPAAHLKQWTLSGQHTVTAHRSSPGDFSVCPALASCSLLWAEARLMLPPLCHW